MMISTTIMIVVIDRPKTLSMGGCVSFPGHGSHQR
jgi:hypothetical protein